MPRLALVRVVVGRTVVVVYNTLLGVAGGRIGPGRLDTPGLVWYTITASKATGKRAPSSAADNVMLVLWSVAQWQSRKLLTSWPQVRILPFQRGDASIKNNKSPGRILVGYRSKRILAHSMREQHVRHMLQ